MLACVDVCYRETRALAACVAFAHWRVGEPLRVLRVAVEAVADYEPGLFYKRELPAVLAVLAELDADPEAVIIDGYVWLGDGTIPGLGAHLYEAIGRRSAVIGVAKTRFGDERSSVFVSRGESRRPLFVTAAGLAVADAAERVRSMHGANRIPTLLRLADTSCRF